MSPVSLNNGEFCFVRSMCACGLLLSEDFTLANPLNSEVLQMQGPTCHQSVNFAWCAMTGGRCGPSPGGRLLHLKLSLPCLETPTESESGNISSIPVWVHQ